MSLTQTQTQKLKALMLANSKPAFFVVDESLTLLDWSDDLINYGYKGLAKGVDSTDVFDFMVGFDPAEDMQLPVVTMPSGVHGSVSTVKDGDEITILILDASRDFEQQYLLQQKANDMQLMNIRLQALLKEIVVTRKELEQKNEKLEEVSRLQSRFLSGVSHEFRTPLSSLIGYSDLLLSNENSDKTKEYVDVISANSKYMLSLVENLLDHGRLDSDELTLQFYDVGLLEFIQSIVEMFHPLAEKRGIQLILDIDVDSSLTLSMDEVRIQQCVVNLLNNAIKFTESGSVRLIVRWTDNELAINVVDTGIGMDEKEMESLFNPFWQSKNHKQVGTGLGMTITSRLIELMGGELTVKSVFGQGTDVGIEIFAVSSDSNEESTEISFDHTLNTDLQVSQRANYKILIVEDDEDIADLVLLRLSEWGYIVDHCENGQDALSWLSENTADLILMDLDMPVMTGEMALNQMRSQGINTPVYIMSAKPLDFAENDQLDAQGQLLKPVNFDLLKSVLEDSLEGGV